MQVSNVDALERRRHDLESAQRDYFLRLRLGTGFDYPAMQAEIHDGVLTITLPKRVALEAAAAPRWARVA